MSRLHLIVAVGVALFFITGCVNPFNRFPDGRHHSNILDAAFRRRHNDREAHTHADPVMRVARELTSIEDDLRRDGTITVKTPDVWGDGNLVYYLQEYEALMQDRTKKDFAESLQAFINRSDALSLQSVSGLSSALAGQSAPANPAQTINITGFAPMAPKDQKAIALEPTEIARQHSTYIDVCQALRRRHLGDDNSRAAGYGLYKFRIPVSVLPGRETSDGWSAVVNLRALMHSNEGHLRDTFRRLATADLVDAFGPLAVRYWNNPKSITERAKETPDGFDLAPKRVPDPQTIVDLSKVYKHTATLLIDAARKNIPSSQYSGDRPSLNEVRTFLFTYLPLIYNGIEANEIFENRPDLPNLAAVAIAQGNDENICTVFNEWQLAVQNTGASPEYQQISWMLAVHAGLLDYNLKRMVRDLNRRGKIAPELAALAAPGSGVYFYNPGPEGDVAQVLQLWEAVIQQEFPLHVFALDSQVEEQNVYDSLSRRRDLQVALAYSVAKGAFNMQQKLAMSRQLGLDEAAIGLNRTVVGFSHGSDTFGWYFHPRVQAPPTESTNIGAFARTLWSTGPTEHYDLKHRKLEPGIRECEVLVAMPSFVHELSFDVTTNWEKVATPGVTKRSYEEMLAQGGRIHQLRTCLTELDAPCYRPGDIQRIVSRIDQLEAMLGMQTHAVTIPYRYEQSGFDLFDRGNNQLRPAVTGYYGLTFFRHDTEIAAEFFISGRNFHPTLTRCIVGGVEASGGARSQSSVEVLSRELIKVKVPRVNGAISDIAKGFEIRVGTPQGLSGPLLITSNPPSPVAVKGWGFEPETFAGSYLVGKPESCELHAVIVQKKEAQIGLKDNSGNPAPAKPASAILIPSITISRIGVEGSALLGKAGPTKLLERQLNFQNGVYRLVDPQKDFLAEIAAEIANRLPASEKEPLEVRLSGHIYFDQLPSQPILTPLIIRIDPRPVGGAELQAPGLDSNVSVRESISDAYQSEPSANLKPFRRLETLRRE